jgi:hypothetical protein
MNGGVEHLLQIMIQSTNKNININLSISNIPHVATLSQIRSKSLIGKELFKQNNEFQSKFKLAIDYIKEKILNINVRRIIIDEINQLLNLNI